MICASILQPTPGLSGTCTLASSHSFPTHLLKPAFQHRGWGGVGLSHSQRIPLNSARPAALRRQSCKRTALVGVPPRGVVLHLCSLSGDHSPCAACPSAPSLIFSYQWLLTMSSVWGLTFPHRSLHPILHSIKHPRKVSSLELSQTWTQPRDPCYAGLELDLVSVCFFFSSYYSRWFPCRRQRSSLGAKEDWVTLGTLQLQSSLNCMDWLVASF